MCPICVGSAMLLLSGAGSASGVAALTLRSITRRRRATENDIDREENDPRTRELKHRAMWHGDRATEGVPHDISDARNGR